MQSSFKVTGHRSDLELRVAGRSFLVHQAILGASSIYFKAVLQRPKDSVELTDITAETAERMLQYIYANQEPPAGLDFESLVELYVAAHSYALDGLNVICSKRLVQALDLTNLLRASQIAERYEDFDIKTKIVDYVVLQGPGVLRSENWKDMEGNNPKFAMEILQEIVKRFRNGPTKNL